jgi:predicted transposase/invertase (TIGR01784 family)
VLPLRVVLRLNTAKDEGIAEGIAKGREESKAEIAKNLKTIGIDVDAIAKSTGLSVDEILKLQ